MKLSPTAFTEAEGKIPRLTRQQEQFVRLYLLNYTVAEAAATAGYATGTSSHLLKSPPIQRALAHFRDKEFEKIAVTRDSITKLFFEAHRKSGTTTEEVAALREIAKMHGLYEPQRIQTVSVNINSERHIEGASDADLLKLAGFSDAHIDPDAVFEGEFTEVGDGDRAGTD
jgi:hypothetical protein